MEVLTGIKLEASLARVERLNGASLPPGRAHHFGGAGGRLGSGGHGFINGGPHVPRMAPFQLPQEMMWFARDEPHHPFGGTTSSTWHS